VSDEWEFDTDVYEDLAIFELFDSASLEDPDAAYDRYRETHRETS
jgi:hypothetical protein